VVGEATGNQTEVSIFWKLPNCNAVGPLQGLYSCTDVQCPYADMRKSRKSYVKFNHTSITNAKISQQVSDPWLPSGQIIKGPKPETETVEIT
jgi:hypothetical protein